MKATHNQNILVAALAFGLVFTHWSGAAYSAAPAQPFSLHARLYSPRTAAIDGTWAMPVVEKVK